MSMLLQVKDLVTSFDTDAGELTAVNGVSFGVAAGQTLAIVGESGCGKKRHLAVHHGLAGQACRHHPQWFYSI